MKSLNQAILNQKQGLEPVIIVGINWTGFGPAYYGDDVSLPDNVYPKILNLPELDQAMNADGSGVAQNITIKLDDTDGTILGFMNGTDVYLAEVNVYQWFKGHSLDFKAKIYEGVIVGPLTWNEADRSVEIQCTQKLSNVEVGFSYDETNVNILHTSLIGKVWPLTFGTPIHYPALQLQEIPAGITTIPFGIPDPSIFWQIVKLRNTIDTADAEIYKDIKIFKEAAKDPRFGAIQANFSAYWVFQLQKQLADSQRSSGVTQQIQSLTEAYAEQSKYFSTKNSIIGGYKFPQNKPIICKIGDQLFTCTFLGGSETITNPNQACPVHIYPFYPPGFPTGGQLSDPTKPDFTYDFQDSTNKYNTQHTINVPKINGVSGGTLGPYKNLGYYSMPTWGRLYPVTKQGFTWITPGSSITLIDDFDFTFLVSYVPGTVVNVYAYKSYNGLRKLTQVPPRYYTIGHTGSVTTITMKRPLSIISYLINERTTESEAYLNQKASDFSGFVTNHTVENTDWEDQIYVTFQSDIGPNVVDILIWLIDNYTVYQYDATTFDSVRVAVANYPANFVVMDRPLVDDLMNDICYQARCSLVLKDGIYYLIYLSANPGYYDSITLDDIAEDSLSITTTPVENIVTRYTATWKTDYSPDYESPNKIILKNNVQKYGLVDGGHDYFIYNQEYLVRKSAFFWLFRTSNVFKILKFNCFLDKLNLEVQDAVSIEFSEPLVTELNYEGTGAVNFAGIITNVGYDSSNYTIQFTIWTPVKLGQTLPYVFAWPASLTETDYFVPVNLITGGGALGYSPGNIPTVSHTALATNTHTVDYSNWPDNPFNNFDYAESQRSFEERQAQGYTDLTYGAGKAQAEADAQSQGATQSGTLPNFYTGAPVQVADVSDPANSNNQLNNSIPLLSQETLTPANPQLAPLFADPLVPGPTTPPGGGGSGTNVYPGQITSGSGNIFQVNIFKNGLPMEGGDVDVDTSPTAVTAYEVHEDETLILDSGTWVTVVALLDQYYIIQPSWAH